MRTFDLVLEVDEHLVRFERAQAPGPLCEVGVRIHVVAQARVNERRRTDEGWWHAAFVVAVTRAQGGARRLEQLVRFVHEPGSVAELEHDTRAGQFTSAGSDI